MGTREKGLWVKRASARWGPWDMAVGGDRRAPGDGQMCPTRPNPGAIHQRKQPSSSIHPQLPQHRLIFFLAFCFVCIFESNNAQIINWATFFILLSTAVAIVTRSVGEIGSTKSKTKAKTNTVNVRPCATCLPRILCGKI